MESKDSHQAYYGLSSFVIVCNIAIKLENPFIIDIRGDSA